MSAMKVQDSRPLLIVKAKREPLLEEKNDVHAKDSRM